MFSRKVGKVRIRLHVLLCFFVMTIVGPNLVESQPPNPNPPPPPPPDPTGPECNAKGYCLKCDEDATSKTKPDPPKAYESCLSPKPCNTGHTPHKLNEDEVCKGDTCFIMAEETKVSRGCGPPTGIKPGTCPKGEDGVVITWSNETTHKAACTCESTTGLCNYNHKVDVYKPQTLATTEEGASALMITFPIFSLILISMLLRMLTIV